MHATPVFISVRKADLKRFEDLARKGFISMEAAPYLAIVFAAMRQALAAIGPGYGPLDAILEALPKRFQNNWLIQRTSKLLNSKFHTLCD